jgi:hypothetical protein
VRQPVVARLRRPVACPLLAVQQAVCRADGWTLVLRREVHQPAAHRTAVSGPAADPSVMSARASWLARPQAEAWSADRCAEGCRPEVHQPEACPRDARSARAALCQPAVDRRVGPLSEPRLEQPAVLDVQARPQAAVVVGAECASAQRPAEVRAPSVQPEVAAAAEVAEPLAPQPAGAHVEVAAEAGAVPRAAAVAEEVAVPHAAGVAEAAEEPALPRVVAEEEAEPVWQRAAEQVVLALPGRQPAARPSAAVPSYPSRLRPAPVQRPAVTRLAVHAPLCSQIAPLRARWWPAARGEVWSW